MAGFLLTTSAVVTCAHGGVARATAPNPRVLIMGAPVPMAAAPFLITGCPAAVPPPAGPGPTPCISASYLPPTATTRVKSMGQGLLCQSSLTGPCQVAGPAPAAPLQPVTFPGQQRVKGV